MNPVANCTTCGVVLPPNAAACGACGTPVPGAPAGPERAEQSSPDPFATPPDVFGSGGEALPPPDLLAQLQAATMGDYTIEEELGRGGMASVFLATEVRLARKVAIKVMSPALLHGPGMVDRFRLEARTIASLSHPNIVPIYVVKEAAGLLFFVMKYVGGSSLDTEIATKGQLPFDMVARIVAAVARALDYAHGEGVIHRDIKPGNILLDARSDPVVTDFGIAKVAQSGALTSTGLALGTPTYMSPEQCRGAQLTGAADQYSLGILAYEMLAGSVPFQADSQWAVMYKHLNTPPPPLTEARPDCPETLMAVVRRMLAKDPADRWASLRDAADALEGRLAVDVGALQGERLPSAVGEPVATRPGSEAEPVEPQGSIPEDHDPGEGQGEVATAGVSSLGREDDHPATDQHSGTSRARSRRLLVASGTAVVLAGGVAWAWSIARGGSEPAPAGPAGTDIAPTSSVPSSSSRPVTALVLTPDEASLTIGEDILLEVDAFDEAGESGPVPALSWLTSDASVARVDESGRVRAVGAGRATVTATGGGQMAEVAVSVRAPRSPAAPAVASVWLSLDSVALTVGEAAPVVAEGRDAADRTVGGLPTLRVADQNVARLEAGPGGEEQIVGTGQGTTTLIAELGGLEGRIPVRVSPELAQSVALEPAALTLERGESAELVATVRGPVSPSLERPLAWASEDPGVVEVDDAGRVRGVAPGTATITATADGQSGASTVRVVAPAAPAAVSSLEGSLVLLEDGAGLRLSLRFVPSGGREGRWCAVARVSHGSEEPRDTTLLHDFRPGPGDLSQEVILTPTLQDLTLDPGDYRAGARLVTTEIAVWGSGCEAPRQGQPLQTATTSICLAKRAFGGWLERPGDCG